MQKRTRILLTGASGAIGLELLKQLYLEKDRYEITVFDLGSGKNRHILSKYAGGIEIVYGDIINYHDVKKVCEGKDFVIHLCAIIPPLADKDPELARKVNVTGTENLVRNLEILSPDAFLIYSSSISVYGDRLANPFITVGDPLIPSEGDEYAKTKIEAEQIICKGGLDWSIFRLTAVMGKHRMSGLMFHMPLLTNLEIATPEDTARAFRNALDKRYQISKKIFNLGGVEACRTTYQEFLSRSFSIMGLGRADFPARAFAEKNFHCGFYNDGNLLEDILHYRKDDLDSYYGKVAASTQWWKKVLAVLFTGPIKAGLLKQSEPYRAFISGDTLKEKHFFNE